MTNRTVKLGFPPLFFSNLACVALRHQSKVNATNGISLIEALVRRNVSESASNGTISREGVTHVVQPLALRALDPKLKLLAVEALEHFPRLRTAECPLDALNFPT